MATKRLRLPGFGQNIKANFQSATANISRCHESFRSASDQLGGKYIDFFN